MHDHTLIIDVDMLGKSLKVVRKGNGNYDVIHGTDIRHSDCSPESVMRALGNYIHSLDGRVGKQNHD